MRKPCRCLLRDDESQRPLYELVRETLDALPEDTRVSDAVYTQRLACCKECGFLYGGTCTLCGCYVEIRCAQAVRCCPDVPARWEALPNKPDSLD